MNEFGSLTEFIVHLATIEHAVHREAEKGLTKAAKLIEKTAKAELGHYQEAVGPYPKWEQLADSTLAQHDRLGVGDSPLLVTGELYASIEHEVEGNEAVIGTKMEIGAYQEFGTDKIPPRPFMGPALIHNEEKIKKIFGDALFTAVAGGASTSGED